MKRPNWYLTKVKKKENKDWTREEERKIYTLRQEGKSTQEIQEVFGGEITPVQIYNAVRLFKGSDTSKCYSCREPLTAKDMETRKPNRHRYLCTTCKDKYHKYKTRNRLKSLRKKICGVCWKKPALPKKTACQSCLSATHRRRYLAGLCGQCGKEAIDKEKSEVFCTGCLRAIAERAIVFRARKRLLVGGR